jgi:hypothetical protein
VLSHEGTLHAAGQTASELSRVLRHFVEDLA